MRTHSCVLERALAPCKGSALFSLLLFWWGREESSHIGSEPEWGVKAHGAQSKERMNSSVTSKRRMFTAFLGANPPFVTKNDLNCHKHTYTYIYHLSQRLKANPIFFFNWRFYKFYFMRKIHRILQIFPFTVQLSSCPHSSCACPSFQRQLQTTSHACPHSFGSLASGLVSHPRQNSSWSCLAFS